MEHHGQDSYMLAFVCLFEDALLEHVNFENGYFSNDIGLGGNFLK